MLTQSTYIINFTTDDGETVGEPLTFRYECDRDAVYDSINSVADPRVPAGATRVDKLVTTTAVPQPRRRNPLTGHFTGGDRGGR